MARSLLLALITAVGLLHWGALAQSVPDVAPASAPTAVPEDLAAVMVIAANRIVAMQEDPGQWPYEGVYRVGGKIPVGYRIGGTGICAEALLTVPGYAADPARQAAVRKALEFVCDGIREPLMSPDDYDGGYDVRGWGMCYGARFLLAAQRLGAVPEPLAERVKGATEWYLAALAKLEIPKVGGWTYSRQPGRNTPCPASPFMTAPCLETLFAAKAQGYAVDGALVERALKALAGTAAESSGYVDYAGGNGIKDKPSQIPGAVGRMCAVEVAMTLAGRGTPERLERAVEAFCAHWDALEVRRAKSGTHVAPYGVAPYYFYYAHYYAAQAIALLPADRRERHWKAYNALLFRTRSAEGTWNDRVFPRSANFGTAMSAMALAMQQPGAAEPARWHAAAAAVPADKTAPSSAK